MRQKISAVNFSLQLSILQSVLVVGLLTLLGSITCSADDYLARDGCLFQATNHWGKDFSTYKASLSQTIDFLMGARKSDCPLEMKTWYMTMAALPVPTNDVSSYQCWLNEKTFLLGSAVRYLQAASNTNCWFMVAESLGKIRMRKRTREQIVGELQSPDSDSKIGESITERRKWLRYELGIQSALVHGEENLLPAVVETIGCRFLPQLDEQEQQIVFSNLVSKARLKANEVKLIENAIELRRQR